MVQFAFNPNDGMNPFRRASLPGRAGVGGSDRIGRQGRCNSPRAEKSSTAGPTVRVKVRTASSPWPTPRRSADSRIQRYLDHADLHLGWAGDFHSIDILI
jgi:hypothetical protein